MKQQVAFQIDQDDNVATALMELTAASVKLRGDAKQKNILASENIPQGHKIALKDIKSGQQIIKYGIVIGQATQDIKQGQWVHLHCMASLYDERSSQLDVKTGVPQDIKYE